MDLFVIYKAELAAKLIHQGFKLIKTEPSRKHPQYPVYMFENTLDFQLALQSLLNKNKD